MNPGPRFRLRPACAQDYLLFTQLLAELEVDDPVPSASEWEKTLLPDTFFFLEADDREAVGYAALRFFERDVHVRNVVIHRKWRRQGAGFQLMGAVAQVVAGKGYDSWRLNVRVHNTPALRLYARMGFSVHHRTHVFGVPWAARERLPLPPRSITVGSPAPEEWTTLEARFDLPPGSLRAWCGVPSSQPLRVHDPGTEPDGLAGIARFDSAFPIAMPFHAVTPAHARALLDEMFRLRTPERGEQVRVVVEDAQELADALSRAGAVLKDELFHMRGKVPVLAGGTPLEGAR